jgi:hypothetical protein
MKTLPVERTLNIYGAIANRSEPKGVRGEALKALDAKIHRR